MPAGPDQPFRLVYFQVVPERLKVLRQTAVERGLAAELRAALLEMVDRLSAIPQTWGEESHRLRHLNLMVYRKAFRGLFVRYAVDAERRQVYVRELFPLSGGPLASE
jgi:hypothetical protein